MSQQVRYSDILSKEQEMDKRLETASSNGVTVVEDRPTMSVKDARKRFEQMTSSASPTPTRSTISGNVTSGSRTAPRPAIKKQKPLEKSESVPTVEKKTKVPLQKAKTDSEIADKDKHSAANAVVNDKGESSKAQSKSKSFKKIPFRRKQSNLATKVTRASSDAEILENKNKHRLNKKKTEEPKSKGAGVASNSSSSSNSPKSPRKSPSHSLTISASAPTTPKSSKKLTVQGFSLLSKSKSDSSKKPAEEAEVVDSSPSHQPVEMEEGGESPKDNGETKTKKRPESPRVIKEGEYRLSLAEGIDVTGSKLKVVLDKQLACLVGGLENDKHPIITIPDVGLKQLDTDEIFDELCMTLLYIKSLLSIEHLSAGVTLLLDARSSKTHGATKHLLEIVASEEFPLSVHMVYIYIKTGLFSRSKQLASSELSSKLHLAYLHDQKELLEHLEESNVSVEMGGGLNYDHRNWVYGRMEYEKVQRLYSHAISSVPQVTRALDLFEVPQSVKDAEHLMQEDLKLKENLVNKIAEAELLIDQFLENLKGQRPEAYKEVSLDTKGYIAMMSSLNSMLQELRAEQGKFDSFWTVHKARVDHMMRMCHFTRGGQKLKCLMQGHIDDLTGGGVVLGDTLENALELGEKHEAFVTKCKTTMDDHMSKIRKDANSLINPKFAPSETEENMHSATKEAIETVKSKLADLSETYQDLMSMCQQKRDLFIVCVKFHMTSRQVQQWNQDVLEFLAQQPYEEPTQKVATQLIADIEDFLGRIQASQITTMTELSNALPKEKQFKKQAEKTAQKYEQTRELLEKRKVSLLKVMAVSNSPAVTQKSKSKKAKNKHEIELVNGGGDGVTASLPATSGPSLVTTNPEASLYLAKALTSESEEDYVDGEKDSDVLKSRQFVYKELVDTEQVYVRDLQTVLDAYYDSMAPDDLSVPLRLRGKRETVFGNLMEIYKFHDTVFRKALERYADHPERVGECFTQFNSEFQMYTTYCKNRTASEALVNECTESETFFKGIQMRLAHQLSLSAYLLKPVQRITKYQLLIKDMMKRSVNAGKAHTDLQSALDKMLKVLKNLNDSLHVVGLKGFPGSLAEQGRLLVHDPFQLLEGSIGGRSLFSRARERHVFLFEKVIIFSKKVEAPVQRREKKSDTYLYKGHLEMADIALRGITDAQHTQFEITVHGQHKLYKFQAQSKEIQEMWTKEITRLLQVQFLLMKDMVIKSGTLDRGTYKGKAKFSRDSRLFGDSFKRHHDVQPAKKSTSRFNILKRRKGSDQQEKKSNSSSGISQEQSSLLVSCSLPPSVKHSIASGSPRSPKQSGLSLSNIETGKSQEDLSFNSKYSDSISSDEDFSFSNDEDDDAMLSVDHYETLAPGAPCHYVAIAEYNPGESDENGIEMFEGQEVEVIGINKYGWWWVRAKSPSTNEKEEGWVPASFLKVLPKEKVIS